MRALDAVIWRLDDLGLGVIDATIFAGADPDLPQGPDAFLTLIETGGELPVGTQQEPSAIRRPHFQITARADDYRVASALWYRVFEELPCANVLIDDVFVLYLRPMQSNPFEMSKDANARTRLIVNFMSAVRRADQPALEPWIETGWMEA